MWIEAEGKKIGQVVNRDGKQWLVKRVRRDKHLFRALQGYGVDANAIDDWAPSLDGIVVIEEDTHDTYVVGMETFLTMSVERDYGYGRQYILPQIYWKASATADQLELFDEA